MDSNLFWRNILFHMIWKNIIKWCYRGKVRTLNKKRRAERLLWCWLIGYSVPFSPGNWKKILLCQHHNKYRGSPTCKVSTSTNFSTTVSKFVLVEFIISKISTSWICVCKYYTTQLTIVQFFPGPNNRTERGLPVLESSYSNNFIWRYKTCSKLMILFQKVFHIIICSCNAAIANEWRLDLCNQEKSSFLTTYYVLYLLGLQYS